MTLQGNGFRCLSVCKALRQRNGSAKRSGRLAPRAATLGVKLVFNSVDLRFERFKTESDAIMLLPDGFGGGVIARNDTRAGICKEPFQRCFRGKL